MGTTGAASPTRRGGLTRRVINGHFRGTWTMRDREDA
jgi:hypothetical protein